MKLNINFYGKDYKIEQPGDMIVSTYIADYVGQEFLFYLNEDDPINKICVKLSVVYLTSYATTFKVVSISPNIDRYLSIDEKKLNSMKKEHLVSIATIMGYNIKPSMSKKLIIEMVTE